MIRSAGWPPAGACEPASLYSDSDEKLFDATRPILINSIENLPTRGDFLDRCVILRTSRIDGRARKPEKQFWDEFERVRPRILGALFSAVSIALRNLPSVQLDHYPRMADFVAWAVAAEPGLGLEPGSFLLAYKNNRRCANRAALDAAATAEPLFDLLDNNNGSWHGDFKHLFKSLGARAGEQVRARDWPRSPRDLRAHLDRIRPNLAAEGVEIRYRAKDNRTRRSMVEIFREHPSHPSQPSPPKSGPSEACEASEASFVDIPSVTVTV